MVNQYSLAYERVSVIYPCLHFSAQLLTWPLLGGKWYIDVIVLCLERVHRELSNALCPVEIGSQVKFSAPCKDSYPMT